MARLLVIQYLYTPHFQSNEFSNGLQKHPSRMCGVFLCEDMHQCSIEKEKVHMVSN